MKQWLLILLFFPYFLVGQENKNNLPSNNVNCSNDYDTDLLPASFFKKNRQALRNLMPNNSVAVLFSNPIRNRSNDVDFEFHQDPNFYYLTGLEEPHAVVVIFKEIQNYANFSTDEILFLREQNSDEERWTGKMTGLQGAKENLKFNYAASNSEFLQFDLQLNSFDNILITNIPEDIKNSPQKADLYGMVKLFKIKTEKLKNNISDNELHEALARLRQIKSQEEITLLRKAIDMTCDAQIELMKALKPNMREYQSEAVIEYIFKHNGAEHNGFPSILGGGENSCVIHYTSNRKKLKDEDLLVSDVGAEYHNYTADVTRTIPVDGHFSEEEKLIYNIVLKAQQAAIDSCIVGNKFWDPHNAATKVIANELLKLGIIDKSYKVRKYFMHGTSHYLGLDVHDAGLHGPLEAGNVITVEPGIYIPEGSDCDPKWWNIGIRIEDDILITNKGPENLSAKAPRTIEAIEALMKEPSKFD